MTQSMTNIRERILVDSLSVEFAGEKIDLPSFPTSPCACAKH